MTCDSWVPGMRERGSGTSLWQCEACEAMSAKELRYLNAMAFIIDQATFEVWSGGRREWSSEAAESVKASLPVT